MTAWVLGAVPPLVEAVLFFGPLIFIVVVLVRGSRRRRLDGDDEETEASGDPEPSSPP